jgi:predicted small integral membrane protein
MDLNDYTLILLLLQNRHAEMVVAAQRNALLRETTRPRRPFRAVLGTALIRLDAWLRASSTVRAVYTMAIARYHGDSSINTHTGGRNDERTSRSSHCRRASDPAAHE